MTYVSKYTGDQIDSLLDNVPTKANKSIPEITKSTSTTLTLAEVSGTIINNHGQDADLELTLPEAAEGMSFLFICGTSTAHYVRIIPDGGDAIWMDGEVGSDGEYVELVEAQIGSAISFVAFRSGASGYEWLATSMSGDWEAE